MEVSSTLDNCASEEIVSSYYMDPLIQISVLLHAAECSERYIEFHHLLSRKCTSMILNLRSDISLRSSHSGHVRSGSYDNIPTPGPQVKTISLQTYALQHSTHLRLRNSLLTHPAATRRLVSPADEVRRQNQVCNLSDLSPRLVATTREGSRSATEPVSLVSL